MTESNIGTYIGVREVFPEVGNDFATFRDLLTGLSRTDTLFWCARLNLILGDDSIDSQEKQRFCASQFFTPEEIKLLDKAARNTANPEHTRVFFRSQLLELMRWVTLLCDDLPEDGNTFDNPEVRRRFAQAALIASDAWEKRITQHELPERERPTLEQILMATARQRVDATSGVDNPEVSVGRGWLLFNTYFPRYYKRFRSAFRCAARLYLKEYYICSMAIASHYAHPKSNPGIFNVQRIKSGPRGRIFARYLRLRSQTADEMRDSLWPIPPKAIRSFDDAPPYIYRPLRKKPILLSDDGRAIILDPVFFADSVSVGPLFLLAGAFPQQQQQAFGAFGNAVEHYALDILAKMFPSPGAGLAKRLHCDVHVRDVEGKLMQIDALLNDMTDLVLFEIKAVWPDETKMAEDYEACIEHLRKKYVGVDGRSGDNKAIRQLARASRTFSSASWRACQPEYSQLDRLYPVMVPYDHLLDIPLYGEFFAGEFRALLGPDETFPSGTMRKDDLLVHSPIVMDIETLDRLEASTGKFGLRDLLLDYSQKCQDRRTSLRNFIYSSHYGRGMRPSDATIEATKELLRETAKFLFGVDLLTDPPHG